MQILPNVIDAVLVFAAIIGAIAGIQVLEKGILGPARQAKLGRMLSGRTGPPDKQISIADALKNGLNFFDFIFGSNHWTIRCATISSIFTILFSIISILLIHEFDRVGYWAIISKIFAQENIPFIVVALFANITVDYFSLWETRFVLNFMKKENSVRYALFLIIVDVLFTLFIFIIIVALCKTVIDMYFIIPLIHKYGTIKIVSPLGIDVYLNSEKGLIGNGFLYYVSMLKANIYSMSNVLGNIPLEYWSFSLIINMHPKYWIPASTMWATTHLASIFIYFYIILWFAVTRLIFLKRIKIFHLRDINIGRIIISFSFSPDKYPITIIAINMILYAMIVYILILIWDLFAMVI